MTFDLHLISQDLQSLSDWRRYQEYADALYGPAAFAILPHLSTVLDSQSRPHIRVDATLVVDAEGFELDHFNLNTPFWQEHLTTLQPSPQEKDRFIDQIAQQLLSALPPLYYLWTRENQPILPTTKSFISEYHSPSSTTELGYTRA